MAVFDFQDASFKGDRNWMRASPRFARYAPYVVLTLAILAIAEIVVGVLYIVNIQSVADNLSFAAVVQPLIVPGISFFNTIPSLHLHVLARSNKPALAIWFSSHLCAMYLVSAIVWIPPCVSGWTSDTKAPQSSYKQNECPNGAPQSIWAANVALQFVSALGYAIHLAMASVVFSVNKRRAKDEAEGRVSIVVDLEEKAKREEEARKRWREIRDL